MIDLGGFAIAGIAAVLLYYSAARWLVCRDPGPVLQQRTDGTNLIAMLVQLAVKRRLRIAWDGKAMRVTDRPGDAPLTADERAISQALLAGGSFTFTHADLGSELASGLVRFIAAAEHLTARLDKQLDGVMWARPQPQWSKTSEYRRLQRTLHAKLTTRASRMAQDTAAKPVPEVPA